MLKTCTVQKPQTLSRGAFVFVLGQCLLDKLENVKVLRHFTLECINHATENFHTCLTLSRNNSRKKALKRKLEGC